MKRFVLASVLACASLSAQIRPYFSVACGPAGENVGSEKVLLSYEIMAKVTQRLDLSPEELQNDMPRHEYRDYLVTVTSRDKLGIRVNGCIGAVIGDVYKIEAEYSACTDRTLIKHSCPDLQKSESHTVQRATQSHMVNVGGYFPGKWSVRPYSMVGFGLQSAKVKDVWDHRFAYQWLTGLESPIAAGVSSYMHHRYRKSLRGSSMHSAEFGIKFSV